MNNKIINKFGDILNKDYINDVISKFKRVRELVFFNGEVEQLINSYLHYDKLIIDFDKQIKSINEDKRKVLKYKKDLINVSIYGLRNKNKLVEWLDNLSMDEINELRNIVDIEGEFKIVDDKRFRERKRDSKEKVY